MGYCGANTIDTLHNATRTHHQRAYWESSAWYHHHKWGSKLFKTWIKIEKEWNWRCCWPLCCYAESGLCQNNDPTVMTINGQPVSRSNSSIHIIRTIQGVIDKKTVDEYVDLFINYKLKVMVAPMPIWYVEAIQRRVCHLSWPANPSRHDYGCRCGNGSTQIYKEAQTRIDSMAVWCTPRISFLCWCARRLQSRRGCCQATYRSHL